MKLRSSLLTLAAALLLGSAAPCLAQYAGPAVSTPADQGAIAVTTDPAILFPPLRELHLGPGDEISISVFGQAALAPPVRMDMSGNVMLPFLGLVNLSGLSINEAQELLAHKLEAAGIYNSPQVTVLFIEGPSASATLIGENHAIVPIIGNRRLLEVLNAAGGLPQGASHVITIQRSGVPQPIVVDLGSNPASSTAANIPIFPGDIIVTSKVGVAYFVGAFKNPGALPLSGNTPLTLMEATALSGGPTFEAKYGDLRIIRTVNNQRSVVKLDIEKVLHGKSPDPILQANDIVYLPSSALKSALSNGSSSLVLSFASFALTVFYAFR